MNRWLNDKQMINQYESEWLIDKEQVNNQKEHVIKR